MLLKYPVLLSRFLKILSGIYLLGSLVSGGIGDSRLSLLAEGRLNRFRPALDDFNKIYEGDDQMELYGLGLGYKNTFLVARYRTYEADGNSIVKGIDLEGRARWRQEFMSLGIRSYALKMIYGEISYVLGSVTESIQTNEPDYKALNSKYTSSDKEGFSITLGVNIPVFLGLNLAGEIEYLFVEISHPRSEEIFKQNMGGPSFGLGLTFVL